MTSGPKPDMALSSRQEELLQAYSPTLARRYILWKAQGAAQPMPRALALGLQDWRQQGFPERRRSAPRKKTGSGHPHDDSCDNSYDDSLHDGSPDRPHGSSTNTCADSSHHSAHDSAEQSAPSAAAGNPLRNPAPRKMPRLKPDSPKKTAAAGQEGTRERGPTPDDSHKTDRRTVAQTHEVTTATQAGIAAAAALSSVMSSGAAATGYAGAATGASPGTPGGSAGGSAAGTAGAASAAESRGASAAGSGAGASLAASITAGGTAAGPTPATGASTQGALPGIVVPRTPGETAPMSNYLARTSLFAPIRKGRRVMHDKQKLHSPEGLDVLYSGKQLDMADQDVYLTALRLAAGIRPGDRIVINRAAFLRMLGYKHNPGARDYKWLEEAFYRISTGRVIIEARNMKANLPLIGALLLDEISGDYYFTIPRETYALWAKNLYGYIDLEKRHALERNVPLSKWLQSYAQSHAPGQHTISMDLLHAWCGYGGRLRDFRDSLIGALEELARVGILKSWSIQVRGAGRQKKNMISWVRERTHRDDTDSIEAGGSW